MTETQTVTVALFIVGGAIRVIWIAGDLRSKIATLVARVDGLEARVSKIERTQDEGIRAVGRLEGDRGGSAK